MVKFYNNLTCGICRHKCTVCLSHLYFYEGSCVKHCPEGTTACKSDLTNINPTLRVNCSARRGQYEKAKNYPQDMFCIDSFNVTMETNIIKNPKGSQDEKQNRQYISLQLGLTIVLKIEPHEPKNEATVKW